MVRLATGVNIVDETKEHVREFWNNTGVKERRGCYVLAIKAAKGYTPIYVGRASTLRFDAEVLNDRNLKNCNRVLADRRKGALCVFLLPIRVARGKLNKKHIADVEEYLIGQAARKNKDLINTRLLPDSPWSITGLVNSGQGQPPLSSQELKWALGIKTA